MSYNHYYMEHASEIPLRLDPEIVYTGVMSDTPDFFNARHNHEFCEILYVAGGSGSAVVNGGSFALKKGDLLIINPGVDHEERSAEDDPLVLIFLAIRDFTLPGQPTSFLLPEGTAPVLSCGEYSYKMDLYFQELLEESSVQVHFYQQIIRNLVSAILILILRLICITPVDERPLSGECRKIKEYLDKNYTSPITLDRLSETVYISKHYISHIFKEETGTSPIKYLTSKRMVLACDLLRNTDLPVSEVSKRVGYDNPLYFSQVFKKLNGVSPLEYRAGSTGGIAPQ